MTGKSGTLRPESLWAQGACNNSCCCWCSSSSSPSSISKPTWSRRPIIQTHLPSLVLSANLTMDPLSGKKDGARSADRFVDNVVVMGATTHALVLVTCSQTIPCALCTVVLEAKDDGSWQEGSAGGHACHDGPLVLSPSHRPNSVGRSSHISQTSSTARSLLPTPLAGQLHLIPRLLASYISVSSRHAASELHAAQVNFAYEWVMLTSSSWSHSMPASCCCSVSVIVLPRW